MGGNDDNNNAQQVNPNPLLFMAPAQMQIGPQIQATPVIAPVPPADPIMDISRASASPA